MRVKLLKSVIVNAISNTEPQPVNAVVEIDDGEGREMVNMGYAEETSASVTAEAKKAPETDNKMAPDASNKDGAEAVAGARNPTPIAPPVKTPAAKTVGTVSGKR